MPLGEGGIFQPSAAKWNILGTNDASFNDGTGIGDGAIVGKKITATGGLLQGVQSVSSSPAPTSIGDVSGSSVTFTLDVASTLLISFGGEFQINAGAFRSLTVYLNIGGANVANVTRSANQGNDTLSGCMDMWKVNLASGSHTIKLRVIASTAGTTAFNGGFWHALVFAQ